MQATTSPVDWVALILLAIVIVMCITETIGVGLPGGGYATARALRCGSEGLFDANPDVGAIAHAPFLYKLHVSAAWAILAVWPFSRLVHAWSYPIWYLWRPFVFCRSRVATRPNEPGTSGRRWRKIGVPY